MQSNPGKTMGDAHRSVAHDPIVQGADPLQDLNNSLSSDKENAEKGINILAENSVNTTADMENITINGNETSSDNASLESEAEHGAEEASGGKEGGIAIDSESGGESSGVQI
jgi:hypothetical protein